MWPIALLRDEMKHVMIDIETVAGPPDGAVVAIGAVKFTKGEILDRFEAYIPMGNAILYGVQDADTMGWWETQEAEVRAKVFGGSEAPYDACMRLGYFSRGADLVWAKPPTFDITILRHLYKQMGLTFPFHFRAERDARTLIALAAGYGVKYDDCYEGSTKHDPLSDALVQTMQIQKCLNLLTFRGS
jgi:hypothetical protein